MRIKKRIKVLSVIMIFVFVIMLGSIGRVYIVYKDDLTTLSTQYNKTLFSYYPRGTIYDRSGIRFTNRVSNDYPFLDAPNGKQQDIAFYLTGELLIDSGNTTASGCVGANGLQKVYNTFLSGGAPIKVMASVDAEGNVLSEYGFSVVNDHPNEGCDIEITLDYNLQNIFETYLKELVSENNYKGAAVVLTDLKSGEMLVMASAGSFMNKTVLSYQPGSIMKIITAAAALESGIIKPDTKYQCSGTVVVDGVEKHCSNKTEHGEITFEQAFAKSCNCFFYELTEKLSEKNSDGTYLCAPLELAKKWGFSEYGSPSEDRFILEYEDHYSFVPKSVFNKMGIFNAALGQGEIQASPYLINKIVAAIANGGSIREPDLVKSITDPSGKVIEQSKEEIFDLGLSDETINALKKMMQMTATEGTARNHTLKEYGGMGGKTGTAESLQNAECHSWYTGFFPAENPQYAMTVMIEEAGSSSKAVAVFDILAHYVWDVYGYKKQ